MSVQWNSGIWRIAVEVPAGAASAFADIVGRHADTVACVEAEPSGETFLVEGMLRRIPDTAAIIADVAVMAFACGIPEPRLEVESLPPTDWLAWSLSGFPPIVAGRYFVHGSHFDGTPPMGRIPLRIDAAMAFGTGEHGSTRGCLIALDRLARAHRFRRVLDMGCGSGILGIAARKTTGARVLGVDLDPISVAQARQNATRNRVSDRVRFAFGDGYFTRAVWKRRPYDLVFANILARPLVRMAPRMRPHLAPGARVVLSGLLVRQDRMVLAAHRMQGLRLVRRHTVGEWRTLVLAR
jgi:ribosomal protein L11 methyltransferase